MHNFEGGAKNPKMLKKMKGENQNEKFKGGDVMKTDYTPWQTEYEIMNLSVQKIIFLVFVDVL